MIFGIGSDIAHIPRFERLFAKRGDSFATKILTPLEFAQFNQRKHCHIAYGNRFLATRFAAKEAFSKACGLGFRLPMRWHAVQIVTLPDGKPTLQGLGAMADWLDKRHLIAHLSLSDEREYAIAYVILESK